ncbi:MAG: proline dehydrogenase family protein [Anaerolineae bacterium]|nr:proline dehydrogenase family protein [Anaerolineae bacterium]
MLRRILLYLSSALWARRIVTHWGVARRMARRFVAGETLEEAITAAQSLKNRGLLVSLDYLGESVRNAQDTADVVAMYHRLLARIEETETQASVSLKLTHLGLDISEDLCITNLRQILTDAQARNLLVTIDMESSAYTERTLRIYRTMHDEYDFKNVGTVLQTYLYRTAEDARALAVEGAHIRLCKGAYLEPPAVAFPQKADVDRNFVTIMTDFLKTPGTAYLCIASHDEGILQQAEALLTQDPSLTSRSEFQMLYGVRSARQDTLAKAGYPVRVYMPFGEAWYPYFMRRLAERPANLWFMVKNLLRN